MNDAITHVSDTALWVATYRATESERPDALFHDPYAGLLAGERGKKIAASMVYTKIMEWLLAIRTVAIDRLITHALTLEIDTVMNLGAGLDTRPYRMQLPSDLRWIEVDFPSMIQYKAEKLAREKPVCRLERIAADLSNRELRRQIFERIGSESKNVLVLTEGVIPYLSGEEAAALSEDLFSVRVFRYWIQDYRLGDMRRWMPRRLRRFFKDSPIKFDAVDQLSFFTRQGWIILETRLVADEADRVQRPMPFLFPWTLLLGLMPRKMTERWRKASGYVLYGRPSSQ